MNRHHAWSSAILVLLLCAVVSQAPAATLIVSGTPNLDGSDAIPVEIWDDQVGNVVEGPDGMERWTGNFNTRLFNVTWDLVTTTNPGINGTINVTNNQPVTMFFATETGVISSVAYPLGSLVTGATQITVSSGGGTAILSAPAGDSIYQGIIAGTTQRELFPAPFSLSTTPPLFASDNDSFSNEPASALAVNDVVSLRHAFVLTGGDTATAVSSFFVDVPSPTGSVLLWIGTLGLCFCRRRRTLR